MSRGKRWVVALLAAFILASSWGVWGTVEEVNPLPGLMAALSAQMEAMDIDGSMDELVDDVLSADLFDTPTMTFDVTGWQGRIQPRGLSSPNAIAVLAAVLMGLLALTPTRGRWPAILALQLAVYGTFHLGVLTVELAKENGVRPAGWGTLGAFAASVIVLATGLADWRVDLASRGLRSTVKQRVGGAFGLNRTQPGRGGARKGSGTGGGTGRGTGGRKRKVLTPASFRRRAAAYLVDCGYIGIWIALLTGVAHGLLPAGTLAAVFDSPGSAQLTILLGVVLPVVFACAAYESSGRHATPGKRQLGLRVRHVGHGKLRYSRSLGRNALKFLPWELAHTALWRIEGWPAQVIEITGLPLILLALVWVILLVNALMVPLRGDGQTLHDLAASTQVLS